MAMQLEGRKGTFSYRTQNTGAEREPQRKGGTITHAVFVLRFPQALDTLGECLLIQSETRATVVPRGCLGNSL